MRTRTGFRMVLIGCVLSLVGGTASAASAATPAATGGGCQTRDQLEVCISADSSGHVIGDAYLLQAIPGCQSIDLYVSFADGGITAASHKGYSCALGHKGPISTGAGMSGSLQTRANVSGSGPTDGDGFLLVGFSPVIYDS